MKGKLAFLAALAVCFVFSFGVNAQRKSAKAKLWKICGNPTVKCRTSDMTFQDYEIPFESPHGNSVIVETEPFYAIVLKSVKLKKDYSNCETAVSENERLEIQKLFPRNKAFALKCLDAGSLYYFNFADDISFIALYAGKTLAEANGFLKTVQATGKYKGVYVRKTQAQVNGT